MKLYELTNDVKLSTHAAAHYTRGEIAKLIRSNPHSVQSLLAGALQPPAPADGYQLMLWAGFDKSGPSLYWIDYLGNMEKMKIGGHGKQPLRRLLLRPPL